MVGKLSLHGKEGLTFDDVLLLPNSSNVLPKEVSLKTRLCKGLSLNIPLVSAAMDTVTEFSTAIALAREGGIGIIHKNLRPEKQAAEVNKVKRSEFLIVRNPLSVSPDDALQRVLELQQRNGIGSFPVVRDKKLVGILTQRDLMFQSTESMKVSDLMTRKVISVDHEPSVDEAKETMHKHRIEKLPIVDSQGRLTGMITATDIRKQARFPNSAKDKTGQLVVGAAIGPNDAARIEKLVESDVDVVVVDTAHGHSKMVVEAVRRYKNDYSIPIVAGNVATPEAVHDLASAGADAVKIGVGPGAICLKGETLILMDDYSVKKIRDINVGDKVITHKNRAKLVTKVYKRRHSGKIKKINVRGCPTELVVTPNHPLQAMVFDSDKKKIKKYGSKYYFDKRKYNKGIEWVEAGKIKKGDILLLPKGKLNAATEISFDLASIFPECKYDNKYVWSEKIGFNPNPESHPALAEKFNTTARIIGNIVHGGKSIDMQLNREVNCYLNSVGYARSIEANKINRFIPVSENLMRLFGYFVAEGYCSGAEKNRQLCFSFSADEGNYMNDVIGLVGKVFGYKNSKIIFKKDRNAATVHVFNNLVACFFEKLFSLGAQSKRLPSFILEQDKEKIKQLLIGAIRGDGSVKERGRVSYSTVSPSLAFQISELMTRLGYLPSISEEIPKNGKWSSRFRVRVSGKQQGSLFKELTSKESVLEPKKRKQQLWSDNELIYLPVEKVNEEDLEMDVYNLEVEEDNSYIANRVIAHNCTTRIISGVGVPQFTAIAECADAAKKYDVPIIADGGVKYSGDIAKALAAGASSVMLGSLFAGCEETPGRTIFLYNRKFKQYRGMGSIGAMQKGSKERYFQGHESDSSKLVPEGVEGIVPYKGLVGELVFQLLGGLRSGMGMVGAANIEELRTKTSWVKITASGVKESHPHGVTITEESPNYPGQ